VLLTGIEMPEKSKVIKAYPNPFSDELTIENPDYAQNRKFEILNSSGLVILTGNLHDKTVVQTSGFTHGLYIIKIENGKSFDFIKVIKK
jgi:dihydroxyacid dehydratase/phosphogluconate dehydratase